MSRPSLPAAAWVLLLFVALAVVHTWPLATNPGGLSRNDNGDTVQIEWTIAWDAHQIFRDPLHLFQGNIFHPSPYSLAYNEHLFALGMMAAPLLGLGLSPVFAYNVLALVGLALTGWTLAIVIHRWTGDWIGGILAGSVVAFNAHTLTRLPHLHALHFEFLPLALAALDRLLREPRVRHGLVLALWFLLMALTANYHMVFALTALAAAFVVRPGDWIRERGRAFLPLGIAGGISAVVMVPFLLPYRSVRDLFGQLRTLDEVSMYGASWVDYLSTAGRLHFAWWSEPFFRRADTSLFPGVIPLVLAAAAIAFGIAFRDVRARMALAVGVAGFLLSFGTALPGYALLYRLVPLLQGIRGANRFGFLAIFAIAILAGFAVAALRERCAGRRGIMALAIGLVVAVNLEALRAPLGYTRFDGIPAIYSVIAREPAAVVVEFPFYSPRDAPLGAAYMLNSTRYWHPLLNGYSAFIPPSYRQFYEELRGFPDAASLDVLRAAGVTHVVVHDVQFGPLPDDVEGLNLITRKEEISLYRLTR